MCYRSKKKKKEMLLLWLTALETLVKIRLVENNKHKHEEEKNEVLLLCYMR